MRHCRRDAVSGEANWLAAWRCYRYRLKLRCDAIAWPAGIVLTEIDTPVVGGLRIEPALLSPLAILETVWIYRWIVAACVVVALAAGIIYLDNATYRYTVGLRVAPNSPDSSGLLSKIGGLAAVAGINLPTDKGTSPFDLYVEAITAPDTAQALSHDPGIMHVVFADQWDSGARKWHPPTGMLYGLSRGLKSLLGLPVMGWHQPGGAELADYIERKVILVRDAKKSIATLELIHQNPAFAGRFLLEMHRTIDASLRRRAAERSREYIGYLTQRLAITQVAEHREALATAIGSEERSLMVASAHSSYAADPFGGTSVSLKPTEPKVAVVLGLAAVVGFAVGVVIAIVRRRRRMAILVL